MADPPTFAQIIYAFCQPYLALLHLDHSGRFGTNQPGRTGVALEAKLYDAAGQPLTTLRIPSDSANPWVRDREASLVRLLAPDQMVEPPQGEHVAAPGQTIRQLEIWAPGDGPWSIKLEKVAEHLVPRDRQVFRPPDHALVLERAYARYLLRETGGASAELIRHTREGIPPADLAREMLPQQLDELTSNFGKYPP